MRQWDGCVEGYIQQCHTRGIGQATIETRQREYQRLGAWLKARKPRPKLEELSSELLIRYLETRSAFKAKATVCSILSDMRQLGNYLVEESIWLKNPLRWIRGPKLDWRSRLPKRISKAHFQRLLETAAQNHRNYFRLLWVAVLFVLYGTGLRRGELVRLNLRDWNAELKLLTIDGRKTGVQRQVPLAAGVSQCLEAYLPVRQALLEKTGRQEEPALFVNRDGQRIKGEQVWRSVRLLAKKAAVPLHSLHQFRHTCASDLLEHGASLAQVQGILGHAYVASTVRYVHVADPSRQEAIGRHPLNEILAALSQPQDPTGA